MKSIKGWSDWYIHPFTLIYLIAAWLNDNLFAYLSALFIVCTHEFGHYYFAKKFNFEIYHGGIAKTTFVGNVIFAGIDKNGKWIELNEKQIDFIYEKFSKEY